MAPPRTSKRPAPASSRAGKQQQISAMLGDRVTKPRTFKDAVPPMLKKQKMSLTVNGLEVPAAQQPAPPAIAGVQSQKRKWRLSEILKKEREARNQRVHITPAFVFQPPHMDARRPQHSEQDGMLGAKVPKQVKPKQKKTVRFLEDKPKEKQMPPPTVSSGKCVFNVTADAPGTRLHGCSTVSGGEAIMYSRGMLPKSHLLLLDVLIALESAMSLLKTRRTLPTFGAVREIVRRSTRRNFTLRILSQLAHIVPEAVAVLPGLETDVNSKRPSDGLILRLDDVDLGEEDVTNRNRGTKGKNLSKLGDSAARIRRSLLHKRLLEHVQEHHSFFLKKLSIKKHDSDVWHPDFNLEMDVDELPAPPLYPCNVPKQAKSIKCFREQRYQRASVEETVAENQENEGSNAIPQSGIREEGESEDCIPPNLLAKVRARSKAREVHASNAEVEKATQRSLLSKLPCTMDTICSVLRGERRSAMGWSQLLGKVEKLHPKKWLREDLEKQFDAISVLGAEWCKKVELKSSRGGFAFRVVSDANFGKARLTVSSTVSYTPTN